MTATLAVSTLLYFPCAIFNLAIPIFSLIYGITASKSKSFLRWFKPSEKPLTPNPNSITPIPKR
jgi:hypothetical protein